jgi:hypothetical protein
MNPLDHRVPLPIARRPSLPGSAAVGGFGPTLRMARMMLGEPGGDRAVERGQRFRAVETGYLGRPPAVWTVVGILPDVDPLPSAQLLCESDRTLRKTLSVSVLTDRRRFVRLS